jgi:hypothetical protein
MADCWPVLTIRQPWCWSIVQGGKPVENRPWKMTYYGSLWLHAGARSRWDPAGAHSPLVQAAWKKRVRGIPGWPGLPVSDVELGRATTLMPFGAIAALAEVRDCHHAERCWMWSIAAGGPVLCSPWAVDGQWHIELANVRPLAEPMPYRGKLGLWYLPAEVEEQARAQLEAAHA